MRIISNFTDYYDFVKQYDQENYPVYKRNNVDKYMAWIEYETEDNIEFPIEIPYILNTYYLEKMSCNIDYIFFCGKIYPRLILLKQKKYYSSIYDEIGVEWEALTCLEKYLNKRDFSTAFDFMTKVENWYSIDWFKQHNTPIARYYNQQLEKNICLKDIGFTTLKSDPFQVWQELDQFYRNMLDESEPINIADIHLAKQKGFGQKYDFRKLPEK